MIDVCNVVDVDQFRAGASTDKCGFYAVASLKFAGRPGQPPTGSASLAAAWADAEYVKYDGIDIFSNENGMTVPMLYAVIADAGLHFQAVGATETGFHTERLTADHVRAWLKIGYPVVLSVAEDTVFDQDLNDKPYAWPTAGLFHVIVATAFDGNTLLCHDTASVDDNGVRPGPRRYDATQLQAGMISATAVVMPWLQRPIDGYDALAGGPIMPIPQGWRDDDGTKRLIAPNNHYLRGALRDYVRNAPSWDAGNMPLEEEVHVDPVELHNPQGGAGQRQLLRDIMLIYQPERGVVAAACGVEIKAALDKIAALQAQVAALQTQLHAAQTPPTPDQIHVLTALEAIAAGAQGITQATTTLKAALHVQ